MAIIRRVDGEVKSVFLATGNCSGVIPYCLAFKIKTHTSIDSGIFCGISLQGIMLSPTPMICSLDSKYFCRFAAILIP